VIADMLKTALKDYDRELLDRYVWQLKEYGCTEDVVFYAKALYVLRNVEFGAYGKDILKLPPEYTEITNYITEKDIFRASVTGGTGLDIYRDKDGKASLWLIPSSEKIDKAFSQSVEWYNTNGATDYLQTLVNNGVFLLYFNRFWSDEGTSSVSLYHSDGYIRFNVDINTAEREPLSVISGTMQTNVYIESVGNSLCKLIISQSLPIGGNEMETVKFLLAAYNYKYLFEETGNEDYRNLFSEFVNWAKSYYNPNKKDIILRLLRLVTETGAISQPIGTDIDSWDFIETLDNIDLD
jgi:hypothetical protein